MIGAVVGGFLMEPLLKFFRGRRRALLWEGLVTVTASGCMCILYRDVIMLCKFIYGMGAASNLSLGVLYMNEMLPAGMM